MSRLLKWALALLIVSSFMLSAEAQHIERIESEEGVMYSFDRLYALDAPTSNERVAMNVSTRHDPDLPYISEEVVLSLVFIQSQDYVMPYGSLRVILHFDDGEQETLWAEHRRETLLERAYYTDILMVTLTGFRPLYEKPPVRITVRDALRELRTIELDEAAQHAITKTLTAAIEDRR